MPKTRCEECDGKGSLYLKIGGDVHIAECSACKGWGSLDKVLTPPPPKRKLSKFGSVNIDDLLDERLENLTPNLSPIE